ncbi:uncharacterized protein LOC125763594 [Anopheles funestus]|uniref:uncharacterized protein LOC125763594 n=1 Tax=Anopheles funestus TaxID=62324 RepID=UPI0020C69C3B|nr:uncharacterized protein LOC125763594 [Anopheles funestus]XP_049282889.1 uncharacterized protein LOC125763594 [Anopheles funestus]
MFEDLEVDMPNTKITNQSDGDASPTPSNYEREKLHMEEAYIFEIAHIRAMVEEFRGDNTIRVHAWIEKLEQVFRALKLNKSQQLIAACYLLTGTACIFRRTCHFKDYDDLKAKLLEEFQGQECNDQDIIRELLRKRLQGEDVSHYVREMIEMANGCNIAEVDLVDIIIDGLEDNSSLVVMLYGAKTIAELKSLLPRYKKRRFYS